MLKLHTLSGGQWCNNAAIVDKKIILNEQTLFIIISIMLLSIDEATSIVPACWNKREHALIEQPCSLLLI